MPKQRSGRIYRRWKSSGALLTNVWIISAQTIYGSTKSISWRKRSWEWALWLSRSRPAILLREDTQPPGDERRSALSACAQAYPQASDDLDTGRSLTADRFGAQPVSLRHAIDDVFGGTAAKRVVQAEGEQHR